MNVKRVKYRAPTTTLECHRNFLMRRHSSVVVLLRRHPSVGGRYGILYVRRHPSAGTLECRGGAELQHSSVGALSN